MLPRPVCQIHRARMDELTSIDMVLRNGVVHATAGDGSRQPDAVAVSAGRIVAVGRFADIAPLIDPGTTVIDCGQRAVVPGIVDAHCHLFAQASRAMQVDCRPTTTPNVDAVIAALRTAIPSTGYGWIRGYGCDDSPLGLGRHLTRHDLDAVSAELLVRVEHRSGHACVLNSAGLDALGIARGTPDPPGGAIVRADDGQPTGLLLDMADWLSSTGDPGGVRRDDAALGTALWQLSQHLLHYGITAATDAGAQNGIARWQAFSDAVADGRLPLRVTMMVGHPQIDEMHSSGLRYGDTIRGGMLSVGHVKIMLTASGGALYPDPKELSKLVRSAHAMDYPVAIHAVERDAVVAAAIALIDTKPSALPGSDRIEHCAECPPDVAELVAQSGATVMPNTGFLHYDGERYRRTVSEGLLPDLYPAGALLARGVPLLLGSDAPVIEPNPWASIAGAVFRRSAEGFPLGGQPVPSVQDALRLHTGNGWIAVGKPADLVVVAPDPMSTPPGELPLVRSALTVVNGRVVWRQGV